MGPVVAGIGAVVAGMGPVVAGIGEVVTVNWVTGSLLLILGSVIVEFSSYGTY